MTWGELNSRGKRRLFLEPSLVGRRHRKAPKFPEAGRLLSDFQSVTEFFTRARIVSLAQAGRRGDL